MLGYVRIIKLAKQLNLNGTIRDFQGCIGGVNCALCRRAEHRVRLHATKNTADPLRITQALVRQRPVVIRLTAKMDGLSMTQDEQCFHSVSYTHLRAHETVLDLV